MKGYSKGDKKRKKFIKSIANAHAWNVKHNGYAARMKRKHIKMFCCGLVTGILCSAFGVGLLIIVWSKPHKNEPS